MLFFINSMPKAGSTSYYYCAQSLLEAFSKTDGLPFLQNAISIGIIPGSGYFVESTDNSSISLETLQYLINLSNQHGDILVKIHSDTNTHLLDALRQGNIKMVFIQRDPRDVVISAKDHAQRSMLEGSQQFSDCFTMTGAVGMSTFWSEVAYRWKWSNTALIVNYEDFSSDSTAELNRLARYLGCDQDSRLFLNAECSKRLDIPFSASRLNKAIGTRWRLDDNAPFLRSLPFLNHMSILLGYPLS